MITPQQIALSGSEHSHQAAIFCWSALNHNRYPQLKFMFAVPNGFFSTKAQKAKMKAEGLRNGVPDVMLPWPNGKSAGLFIEMKTEKYRTKKNGGCSEEQMEYIDYLSSSGYQVNVCYKWFEAVQVIEEYLK